MFKGIGGVLFFSMVASCSPANSNGAPAADGAVVAPQTATLAVSSPTATGLGWEGVLPLPESYRLTLTVVLRNVAAAAPLPTTADRFSLVTDSARVVQASAVSRECLGGERLAVGGQASCQLTFSVARGQRPARVAYDSGAGASAEASVPAIDLAPLPLTPENACLARESIRHFATSQQCDDCGSVYCDAERRVYNDALTAERPSGCRLLTCVADDLVSPEVRCGCIQGCFAPSVWQAYSVLTRCYVNRCWDACAGVSTVRDAGR